VHSVCVCVVWSEVVTGAARRWFRSGGSGRRAGPRGAGNYILLCHEFSYDIYMYYDVVIFYDRFNGF
jgi:hypothetical protein